MRAEDRQDIPESTRGHAHSMRNQFRKSLTVELALPSRFTVFNVPQARRANP